MIGWLKRMPGSAVKPNLKPGDFVTSTIGCFVGYKEVESIREVNGPEGDAVKLKYENREYWSKYLKKV